MKHIPYATKYRTTLSQDEEEIIRRKYGRNATPKLFEDKSIDGLIRQNFPKKDKEAGWKVFAKMIYSI